MSKKAASKMVVLKRARVQGYQQNNDGFKAVVFLDYEITAHLWLRAFSAEHARLRFITGQEGIFVEGSIALNADEMRKLKAALEDALGMHRAGRGCPSPGPSLGLGRGRRGLKRGERQENEQ